MQAKSTCQHCGDPVRPGAKYCLRKACQNEYHRIYRAKQRAGGVDGFYNGMTQKEYFEWIMNLDYALIAGKPIDK